MSTEVEFDKDLAKKIGVFYLTKNGNNIEKAIEEIIRIQILNVRKEGDKAVIVTARLGALIGKRGENIDKLTEHLGMKVKVIEQESLLDVMTCWEHESDIEYDNYYFDYGIFDHDTGGEG